jgi:uncharacterized protein (TIGR02391 family)
MPSKHRTDPPALEQKIFASAAEIDLAIKKLQRRIDELARLDIAAALSEDNGTDDVAISNVRDTIREIFGLHSPECREHEHIRLWAGPLYINMSSHAILEGTERGRNQVQGILRGLIERLAEKKADLAESTDASPRSYFSQLNLHPRIADVSRDLFLDSYHWEAVFAGAKALVNYVKERSGRDDLDGAPLMRAVFSKNNPILAFNVLVDQTDQDEQEGMMHLFEGAVLGIRNPGGHSFPEGPEQRAVEYISLLSLLAYRVQESTRRASPKPP